MEAKSAVHFLLKMQQKILPAQVGIALCMLQGNAIYRIGLNQHIGELTLVRMGAQQNLRFLIGLLRSSLMAAYSAPL